MPRKRHEYATAFTPHALLAKVCRRQPLSVRETAAFVGLHETRVQEIERVALLKMRAGLATLGLRVL